MTLIEVIAALAVAGLVVLGAVALMGQTTDTTERIVVSGANATELGNGRRALRRFLREAEPSGDTLRNFRGDERSFDTMTRCTVSGGWSRACHVVISIDSLPDSSVVVALSDDGARMPLWRVSGVVRLRYFDYRSPDSAWTRRWQTHATLPAAVGFLVGSDTGVIPVASSRD
jgi:type II secretory pathway component PulJ